MSAVEVSSKEQVKEQRRRVRVWFGEYVIAEYVAEPAMAQRYETAMRRRFAGLHVTNELVGRQPARVR